MLGVQVVSEMRSKVEQQAYLRSMLLLNPSEWAGRGIAQRSEFLYPPNKSLLENSPSQVSPQTPQATGEAMDAHELLRLIEDCRNQFWSPESVGLLETLARTNFESAPELATMAKRLVAWHVVREQLRELVMVLGLDSLAGTLHAMATMTAREIALAKFSLEQRQRTRRGHGVSRQAMRIKRQAPEVYRLDSQWLDDVIRFKRRG